MIEVVCDQFFFCSEGECSGWVCRGNSNTWPSLIHRLKDGCLPTGCVRRRLRPALACAHRTRYRPRPANPGGAPAPAPALLLARHDERDTVRMEAKMRASQRSSEEGAGIFCAEHALNSPRWIVSSIHRGSSAVCTAPLYPLRP